MTNDDRRIGVNIAAARKKAGGSQGDLAALMRQAGWNTWRQTTVSRVERGAQPLRLSEAIDIAELLGVTIDSLALGARP